MATFETKTHDLDEQWWETEAHNPCHAAKKHAEEIWLNDESDAADPDVEEPPIGKRDEQTVDVKDHGRYRVSWTGSNAMSVPT